MAKRKTSKGPGRGRRGAVPIDPVTKRFIKTESSAPAAVPIAPPITPETVKEEISGFRKALLDAMRDLGADQSAVQDTILDGLRETAEKLVAEQEKIFGKRVEKTVEQSAAYEILEGVVRLGESAAKAKTVAEKRKILQRLRTYKTVTAKVFAGGGDKKSAVAGKILKMIETIEKPLSKESGRRAAIREGVTEYVKTLPEKMARKIPLVGGIVGGSLQRRRERKEEEAEALSSLTEEISRAGKSSLYGRKADFGAMEPDSSFPDVSQFSPEPPIAGGTPVSALMGGKQNKEIGFDRSSVQILGQILVQVSDMKKLLFEQYDPGNKDLKEEESQRETADKNTDTFSKLKGLFGRKGRTQGTESAGGGSGIFQTVMNTLGLGGISKTVGSIISTIGGIASGLGTIIGGIAGAVGTLASTIGAVVSSVAGLDIDNRDAVRSKPKKTILTQKVQDGKKVGSARPIRKIVGKAAVVAAPLVAAAGTGTAIGLGAAYGVNKGIDAILGTNLAEKMFEPETWTFSDVKKDIEREELGKKIEASQREGVSSPEYISAAKGDIRRLPDLVRDGKLSGTEGLSILSDFEKENGKAEDTEFIRQRIKDIDPSAVEMPPLPAIPKLSDQTGELIPGDTSNTTLSAFPYQTGELIPGDTSNTTQQYLNSLNQSREALINETATTTNGNGGQINSVIAPNTTNNNVSINTPSPSGVRNNDPTLKAAERATI
jgi:hypothetical protein